MTDFFYHYRCPRPRALDEPLGYLSLLGRAAVLGGPLFFLLFFMCMGIIKIYFFFYLSYSLRLLLIVCGDVESYPGPGSDKTVRVLYSNILDLHANLNELVVAGSDYDVLVWAESKVSDHHHLSELRNPGFGYPQ